MKALSGRTLTDIDPFVDEIVRYSMQFSGKCLRPALLFLVSRIFGPVNEKQLHSAAAIEFIHTATLIHDDILDGASIRRHLKTVNVRWNAQVGVLAGDLLLAKALELMATGGDLFGIQRLTEACCHTCEGELRQVGGVGDFRMPLEKYLEIIGGKTASLLACSAELGAYYSSAGRQCATLFRQFGHKIGVAFQMIDDILDLTGTAQAAGKTLRTDLFNRKPTLPVILYLQQADSKKRQAMLDKLEDEKIDADSIVKELYESGAVESAKNRAVQEIDEALGLIAGIQGSQDAKSAINEIARFVTQRNN